MSHVQLPEMFKDFIFAQSIPGTLQTAISWSFPINPHSLYLYRLCVVEVGTQVHEDLGHPGGHIIRAGQDASTQTQYTCMSLHKVYTQEKWKFQVELFKIYKYI